MKERGRCSFASAAFPDALIHLISVLLRSVMKASLLLLLLLVGVNFSARAQSDKLIKTQAYKAYSRSGLEKLRSGDSDGAIADFTEAIKVAPAAGDEALAGSYVNRSVPFQSKGDLDAALADVNKA